MLRMPSLSNPVSREPIMGNVHLLTLTCCNRQRLFENAAHADVAMQLLAAMDREGLTTSLAWLVMPDHVRWLAQLRGHPPGYCVQRFKARSSFLINRHRGRNGAVWQAGYFDQVIDNDASLPVRARQVLAHPVRAGLAGQVGEYPHGWCRWPLQDAAIAR